jgi:hypothetical protein
MLRGEFSIQSSGTGSRNIILAEGDRLTGLHRPIAIMGGQPDDLIVVTFDLRRGNAELRFQETEVIGEMAGDPMLSISSVAERRSQDDQKPFITLNDLTGDGKEWRPISAAPEERELEVRLEDSFGRYVLMFPCKLVPGQGWINSRLETLLPAIPVDWRHWDEASVRF